MILLTGLLIAATIPHQLENGYIQEVAELVELDIYKVEETAVAHGIQI
jgi:hypothetical protein